MNIRNRFYRLFLAPDADVATLGGGIAEVIPSAGVAPSVTDVILGDQPSIESSAPVRTQEKERQKLKGPESFGGETAEDAQERMGLAKDRKRGPDGKFAKNEDNQGTSTPAKPVAKQPASQPKPIAKTPAPKPGAPVPTPETTAKLKIGDAERTAEEWAKELAELRAKAEQKPAETALPKPPESAKTPEQEAAETQQREEAFLERASAGYQMTEADHDKILVGGPDGVKAHMKLMARGEMNSRKFAADQIQKMADHFEQRLSELAPIRESHEAVQRMLADTAFLNAHEDIKTHPQGLETYRAISKDFEDGYNAIQTKIAAGTASKSEQGWALQYEDMTPEARRESAAEHTRAKLAALPAVPVAKPPGNVVQMNKPTVPSERPLSSVRPSGNTQVSSETREQQVVREANRAAGVA